VLFLLFVSQSRSGERGYNEPKLYIEVSDNSVSPPISHYSYPDIVCMAVLEYYAFESKSKNNTAVANYRKLATYGLQRFIYDALGYAPDQRTLESWRHFHDRVSILQNKVPDGYFSIFNEIAGMTVDLIINGFVVSDKNIPDISVGSAWATYWKEKRG